MHHGVAAHYLGMVLLASALVWFEVWGHAVTFTPDHLMGAGQTQPNNSDSGR